MSLCGRPQAKLDPIPSRRLHTDNRRDPGIIRDTTREREKRILSIDRADGQHLAQKGRVRRDLNAKMTKINMLPHVTFPPQQHARRGKKACRHCGDGHLKLTRLRLHRGTD